MELYLFASPAGTQDASPASVFYKVDGESVATSLCRLFTKEYAYESPRENFHCRPVMSFEIEERVLMNETLDWLSQYDDPDPGIYDPSPPQNLLDRAMYAIRARDWEEQLLRVQAEATHHRATPLAPKAHIDNNADEREIPMKREGVFVSYSHNDKKLFGEFQTMLAPAIQRGMVDVWDDSRIITGTKWKKEIQDALRSARIAVLLVSPHFLASEFIAEHELPPLLKAAEDEGVTVFWICLSSCLYEQTEIAGYEAAHDVSKPLDGLTRPQRQAVLSKVCAELIRLAAYPTSA